MAPFSSGPNMALIHPAHITIAFNERINNRDLAGLEELMAEDHVLHRATGRRVSGRAHCMAVWDEFFRTVPNCFSAFEKVITKDHGVVIATGSILCSQDSMAGPALWMARVRDGVLLEWVMMSDTPENRRHFGLAG